MSCDYETTVSLVLQGLHSIKAEDMCAYSDFIKQRVQEENIDLSSKCGTLLKWHVQALELRLEREHGERREKLSFKPMMEGKTAEGQPWKYPDIDIFEQNQIDYLTKQAGTFQNPFLAARYYDISWVKSGNFQSGKKALENYIACLRTSENVEGIDRILLLFRARELACSLKQPEIQQVATIHLEWLRRMHNEKNYQWAHEVVHSLLEIDPQFYENDVTEVVSILETAFDIFRENPFFAEHTAEALINMHSRFKEREKVRAVKEKMADIYERYADVRRNTSNLIAGEFYNRALQQLRYLSGTHESQERILSKMKTSAGLAEQHEFKEIRGEIQIPSDLMKPLLEKLESLSQNELLDYLITTADWIPKLASVERRVAEQLQSYPLLSLFETSVYSDKKLVAKAASEEEIKRLYVSNFTKMDYDLAHVLYVDKMLDPLTERKSLKASDIIQLFADSQLLTTGRKEIISIGIERFLEKDFISSLSILVPQVEGIIRSLASQLGCTTTKYVDDRTQERGLGDLLKEEVIVEFLGQDFSNFLKVFLTDQKADNLRNELCHGFIDTPDKFSKRRANFILLSLFHLASYKLPVKKDI